jgi:hypothetical protein
MSATHEWSESNLVGQDITDDIDNINFGSDDVPNLVPASSLIIKGANSYSKYIRCKFTSTWTDITNMKLWKSSGDYKTGETIKAAANQAYATPSQTGTGDSNVPTTEGTALAINSAEAENHIEYGASGVSGYTGYIRLQLQTTSNTEVGAVNQKEFTFQYDES